MAQQVQRNAPCPCGSGRKYKKCCMLEQRNMAIERIAHREGIQQSLAWIGRHYQPQIDQWVEDVWLAGIDAGARQGIASADARIRSIHDVNLLEQLVAEGRLPGLEGESRPLQLILSADDVQLDEDQHRYLEQLQRRPLRLYRVVACSPGEAFTLSVYPDPDGEPAVIADKWASRMFEVGDTVGLRLMQMHGSWETSGAIYHIPDEHVVDLLALLENSDDYSMALIRFWLDLVAAHA